jgi:hypothetical protein
MILSQKKKQWIVGTLSCILILILLSSVALVLDGSHSPFRQYVRTIKANKKSILLAKKYAFQGEGHFCHLDPSLSEKQFYEILSQPFTFLAKGKQTEVYESLDGKYVLRCITAKEGKKSKVKMSSLLKRALLAWNKLRSETGLVAIAQAPIGIDLPQIILLNAKGTVVTISPQRAAFFLQKKAIPLKKAFLQASYQKNQAKMEGLIASTFSLLSTMREAHIIDLDGALIRNGNLGVVQGKVILLDIGKLELSPNRITQTMKDIERLRPLYHWLFSFHKELVPFFLKYQESYKNSAGEFSQKK